MGRFAGKRVWIIGASDGIGAALARAFWREGASLILSSRNEAALSKLGMETGGVEVHALDIGDGAALRSATERICEGGLLDIVVCTAALYEPSRICDIDPDRAEAMMRVNILGTLNVARLCPPLLREGGQLVLFGSVAGYFGLPRGQAYSATKAAVNNIAESLASELAPRIDVRLVCPGFVQSRLTEKNDFTMPAIITAEEAAERTLKGLVRGGFEIHFPRRFTLAVKLLRLLPYWLSMYLARRLS